MLSPDLLTSPIDGTSAAAIRWVLTGAGLQDGLPARVVLRSGWLGEGLLVDVGGQRVLVPLEGARLDADELRLPPTAIGGEGHPFFLEITRGLDADLTPFEYVEGSLRHGQVFDLYARLQRHAPQGGFRDAARPRDVDAVARAPVRMVIRAAGP